MINDDRTRIDHNDQYLTEGLRTVEERALQVMKHLHEPSELSRTRDAIQIDVGGEGGIVILVTREALELRLPSVEWTMGAYGPARVSRLWKRFEWDDIEDEKLFHLISAAHDARCEEFRRCRYCSEEVPPGHRHSQDVCLGCASRHLGIVY